MTGRSCADWRNAGAGNDTAGSGNDKRMMMRGSRRRAAISGGMMLMVLVVLHPVMAVVPFMFLVVNFSVAKASPARGHNAAMLSRRTSETPAAGSRRLRGLAQTGRQRQLPGSGQGAGTSDLRPGGSRHACG
jgi:hypothetical protein